MRNQCTNATMMLNNAANNFVRQIRLIWFRVTLFCAHVLVFVVRCLNFPFRSRDREFPDPGEPFIDLLPDELMIEIFKMLPLEDIIQCEEVNQRWRKVARDNALWRRMLVVCSAQRGEISEKKLQLINTHSMYIHCLKIQYILNYQTIRSVIDKCKNLTSIELIMSRIEKEFEEDIKKWPNLKKINLKNSLLKSSTDLQIQFDHFQKLNFLGLSDFGLSSANCESLLKCQYLNHINIEKIRGLSLEFIKVLIKTKQSMLITLHLYGGTSIDDECLFMLARCPELKDLAILRCENLTDKALVGLSQLQKVRQLQIWNNTTFSEAMLIKALECPILVKLKSLSLSKITNISPPIVDIISEYYKNLTFLALYQCPKIIRTDYEKQLQSKFRNIQVVLY